MVGRLGGDEFLVLLPQVDDEAVACAVAERLLAALAVPAIIEGHGIPVRASRRVPPGARPQRRAAAARLRPGDVRAKRVDGSAVVTFDAMSTTPRCAARGSPPTCARRWAQGQFALHYQTVVDVRLVRADAAEASLRWQHRVRHRLAGRVRVLLLERSGLIVPVGLSGRCAAPASSCSSGRPLARRSPVAVNASVVQLARSNLRGRAGGHRRHRHRAPRITIEVTESVLMDNPERCIE